MPAGARRPTPATADPVVPRRPDRVRQVVRGQGRRVRAGPGRRRLAGAVRQELLRRRAERGQPRSPGAEPGDVLLFVADDGQGRPTPAWAASGSSFGDKLGLSDEGDVAVPVGHRLPAVRDDDRRPAWVAAAPPVHLAARPRTMDLLEQRSGQVRAQAYDLVLNGIEIGGGSIRIHRQRRAGEDLRGCSASPKKRPSRSSASCSRPSSTGPAPRRHRVRPRPPRHADVGRRPHPRRDRLPEDPEGRGPDVRGPTPVAGRSSTSCSSS